MDIKNALKNYRINKAKVESAYAQIEAWEKIRDDPNIEKYGYYTSGREIGMPSSGRVVSQVEKEVFGVEEERALSRELVQQWIDDEKSRIWLTEMEVNQIEIALKSITAIERYIVECQYFENMTWASIEINYNEKYGVKNPVTEQTLKNNNSQALAKLSKILAPFFEKYPQIKDNRQKAKKDTKDSKVTVRQLTEEEKTTYGVQAV